MHSQIGAADRFLRICAGTVILYQVLDDHLWGYLGILPMLTGTIGWCPLYRLLRISTCGDYADHARHTEQTSTKGVTP
jgi:hypothetical protein